MGGVPGKVDNVFSGRYRVCYGDDETTTESVLRAFVEPAELDVLNYIWARKVFLPTWYALVKVMVLMQPSSAAAERVFSLLQAFFAAGGRRGSTLKDERLATIQLRSHDRPT